MKVFEIIKTEVDKIVDSSKFINRQDISSVKTVKENHRLSIDRTFTTVQVGGSEMITNGLVKTFKIEDLDNCFDRMGRFEQVQETIVLKKGQFAVVYEDYNVALCDIYICL
jgi:hypothetical protein